MDMPHWLRIGAGALIGFAGLLLLARLDVPYIERGGWPAVLAGIDLTFFSALLGGALTLASMYPGDENRPD